MKKTLIPSIRLTRICLPHRIRLLSASLQFGRRKSGSKVKPAIVLENGFGFLLESGGRILLEKDGTKAFPPIPKPQPVMCLESGSKLLMEDGCGFQLEINHH